MDAPQITFDRGPLGSGSHFAAPVRLIRADTPQDVPAAFAAMQQAQDDGLWLAGYASYELGYLFSSKLVDLMPPDRALPLMQFGAFAAPVAPVGPPDISPAHLTDLAPLWDEVRYGQAFRKVHDYICAGDIYQANLTFPLSATLHGTTAGLFHRLQQRQTVRYGAYVALDDIAILSRSPELFFSLTADGQLTTKPMKGTAPVGETDAENARLAQALHTSEKDRAENLMIVDLLRNDMSRISEVGSVKVPELFEVERFATVHQMTSRITSRVAMPIAIRDVFEALFPCGSVTGAPKVRAMQVIRELEDTPREVYCGSIGWIAPDGAMEFNVAIRTLIAHPDGTVRLNVGGGVVYDSQSGGEYEEALWKSRFARLA